jgi:hypothetical protein
MVARIARIAAQLRSQRRSLGRVLFSTLALLLLTTLAWMARPQAPVHGRAATPTPDNILAPSGDKTPPIPIEPPPGTLPTPVPTESPTDVPTVAPTETAVPTATPVIAGPPPALLISEFLADPTAVGDSEGECS